MPPLADDLKASITGLAADVNKLLDAVGALPPLRRANGGVYFSPADINGLIKTLDDLARAVEAVTTKLASAPGEPVPVEPVSPPAAGPERPRQPAHRNAEEPDSPPPHDPPPHRGRS